MQNATCHLISKLILLFVCSVYLVVQVRNQKSLLILLFHLHIHSVSSVVSISPNIFQFTSVFLQSLQPLPLILIISYLNPWIISLNSLPASSWASLSSNTSLLSRLVLNANTLITLAYIGHFNSFLPTFRIKSRLPSHLAPAYLSSLFSSSSSSCTYTPWHLSPVKLQLP